MGRLTRRYIAPVAVTAGAVVVGLGAIATVRSAAPEDHAAAQQAITPSRPAGPAAPATSADGQVDGLLRIQYQFHRLDVYAGNQVAVWIETEDGRYVASLFVSSFTANGGWTYRPESLQRWQSGAGWANASQQLIEKVSRPTPQSGEQTLYWDGTNDAGDPMPAGRYRFVVEGNLNWGDEQIVEGGIDLSRGAVTATGTSRFAPNSAARNGTMFSGVRATYAPGAVLEPSMITTYTRGS